MNASDRVNSDGESPATPGNDAEGTSPGQLYYLPQLDGVRAIAILLVLMWHFEIHEVYSRFGNFGRFGVLLFFVLSGFLITGILLRCRDFPDPLGTSKWHCLRSFYARRFLRIFPIYYGTILIATLLDYGPIREHLVWHLTYTSNISGPFLGLNFGAATHWWSLCVEEQFYLIWPFIVLFTPVRMLPRILVLLIAASVVYKFLGVQTRLLSRKEMLWPLIGCLESLGLGALLAVYWHGGETYRKHRTLLLRLCICVGVPLIIYFHFDKRFPGVRYNRPYLPFVDLAASLSLLLLVDRAARNQSGIFGGILSFAPLRYIGKISYGMYLYHLFLIPLLPRLLNPLGIDLSSDQRFSRFVVLSLLTITLAALSWHLIEYPINSLKRYFPYLKPKNIRDD